MGFNQKMLFIILMIVLNQDEKKGLKMLEELKHIKKIWAFLSLFFASF